MKLVNDAIISIDTNRIGKTPKDLILRCRIENSSLVYCSPKMSINKNGFNALKPKENGIRLIQNNGSVQVQASQLNPSK